MDVRADDNAERGACGGCVSVVEESETVGAGCDSCDLGDCRIWIRSAKVTCCSSARGTSRSTACWAFGTHWTCCPCCPCCPCWACWACCPCRTRRSCCPRSSFGPSLTSLVRAPSVTLNASCNRPKEARLHDFAVARVRRHKIKHGFINACHDAVDIFTHL